MSNTMDHVHGPCEGCKTKDAVISELVRRLAEMDGPRGVPVPYPVPDIMPRDIPWWERWKTYVTEPNYMWRGGKTAGISTLEDE